MWAALKRDPPARLLLRRRGACAGHALRRRDRLRRIRRACWARSRWPDRRRGSPTSASGNSVRWSRTLPRNSRASWAAAGRTLLTARPGSLTRVRRRGSRARSQGPAAPAGGSHGGQCWRPAMASARRARSRPGRASSWRAGHRRPRNRCRSAPCRSRRQARRPRGRRGRPTPCAPAMPRSSEKTRPSNPRPTRRMSCNQMRE